MDSTSFQSRDRLVGALVLTFSIGLALISALPYAGSWNDGSRLATVEAIVDHHTLTIDRSIFVNVPQAPLPYRAEDRDLTQHGTLDKLYINGHFYSDKSPVPAILMAAVYQTLQWVTGLRAGLRPDRFCYLMTVASSGLAYVIGVWCIYRLGRLLGLPLIWQTMLTTSFAIATVAPVYARHTNNHILLLGVAAALMLNLAHLGIESGHGQVPLKRLVFLGSLAGFGYTIDLGAGPPLLVCLAGLVLYRCRKLSSVIAVILAALAWLVLHHSVNYAVGGTMKPANAVAEYFDWPGCPFNAQNMTGNVNLSIGHFVVYGAGLLVGKRGFLLHNLPLFVLVPGVWLLRRRRLAESPELAFALFWSGGTWLAYALTSTNYSGLCCSIRWFVPLLAPGYYGLAIALRECPRLRGTFLCLTGWGSCMAALMWWQGPWMARMVPLYWPLIAAAILTCVLLARRRPNATASKLVSEQLPASAHAA
jgi:hypothetical protein